MAGFHWKCINFNWFRKHKPTLEAILNSVVEKSAKNIKDTVVYTHRLESLSTIKNLTKLSLSLLDLYSWVHLHLTTYHLFWYSLYTSVSLLLSSLCKNCQILWWIIFVSERPAVSGMKIIYRTKLSYIVRRNQSVAQHVFIVFMKDESGGKDLLLLLLLLLTFGWKKNQRAVWGDGNLTMVFHTEENIAIMRQLERALL